MITHLPDLVERIAGKDPYAPALTSDSTTLSYGELWHSICRFAGGLVALGTKPDERVAVYLDKRLETVVSLFGCSTAGAVFVPINPMLKGRQVGHILVDCTVRVLVTTEGRLHILRPWLRACPSLRQVIVVDDGGLSTVDEPDAGEVPYRLRTWREVHELTAGELPPPGIDTDLAAILYTSGSTGAPKGVVLSHRNLVVGAESVHSYLNMTETDRILAVLPLSFDAGLSQLTTGFCAGAHVVLTNYLLPRDVVRLCAEHRVTALTCVPPLWIQLAEQVWTVEATAHLRYFANTGGRLPRATLQRLRSIFPQALPYLMYGLTEAFRSTYLDPAEVDRRPSSIGKAIPNAQILVVREDGSRCTPGEVGELVHRGPLVSLGYWNDAERTAERFRPPPGRPGELCTPELAVWSGDLVQQDEDGFLYFVGRRDDMIKSSGYRISPVEIEEVAYETALVKDAVALGIEDERLGHRVVLLVTAREGVPIDVAVLLDNLRRALPRYMVPASVVVRADLPRSPNGKFDRSSLRDELLESAGRTE